MINDVFRKTENGIEISIYLVPGSSRERVIGEVEVKDGERSLKIALHDKPVENKANEALIKFIAKLLGVPKSDVSIKRGQKSRIKQVEIKNFSKDVAERIFKKSYSD